MDNYNYNGFPTSYQPNWYYQPSQTTAVPMYQQRNWQQNYQMPQNNGYQTTNSTQQMNNSMIWVQGEAGAKSYVLPNNTTLPLWDSEAQTIYIKTVDQNGKPTMTILDYVDRNAQDVVSDNPVKQEYVTNDQMEKINEQFTLINKKLDGTNKYATKDQIDDLNKHLEVLGDQVKEIEDRITSFGKPQQNSNSNNRRGNK